MKIVGQSTLANGTSYVHLGYTAATYTKPNMALLGGGLVTLTLGVAMAFPLAISKTASGSTVFNFVRRKSWQLVFGGVVFIIIGCISLVLAMTSGQELPLNPGMMTRENGYMILREVAELREEGNPIPSDPAAFDRSNDAASDGWGVPMRLVKKTSDDGLGVYSVLSAGADGKFDTEDDIRISSDPPEQQ